VAPIRCRFKSRQALRVSLNPWHWMKDSLQKKFPAWF
jgi:hypothetical protein